MIFGPTVARLFKPNSEGVDGSEIPNNNLGYTPPKTNMAMEHPPFEDVFPIENGDFPMSC